MLQSKFNKPYISCLDTDFNSIAYKIHCGCGVSRHDTYVEFEFDKSIPGEIRICIANDMLWTDNYYKYWYEWPKKIWERFKVAAKVLFTGHISVAGDVILYDEEHVEDCIEMLKEGLENMRKLRSDT